LQEERLDEGVRREVADHEQKRRDQPGPAVAAAQDRGQLPEGDRLVHPDRWQEDHLQDQREKPEYRGGEERDPPAEQPSDIGSQGNAEHGGDGHSGKDQRGGASR
jgi:hypothetical protein